MKRAVIFLGPVLFLALLLPSRLASPVAASDPTYSFTLTGPNTAEASSGDTIRVTGSGTFNTGDAGSVVASGSFTHFLANGSVFARGTWQATAFNSFRAFGGPNPGTQGGVLEITVTLFPNGGARVTGVPMSVTCRVHAPAGFTEDEGTTVAEFTEKTGGLTLFHLQK